MVVRSDTCGRFGFVNQRFQLQVKTDEQYRSRESFHARPDSKVSAAHSTGFCNNCHNFSAVTNELAAKEDFEAAAHAATPTIKEVRVQSVDSIQEDEEEEEEGANTSKSMKPPLNSVRAHNLIQKKQKPVQYKWKIDLSKTEPFWVGWFQGMSQKFIDLHVRKVLLLANLTMDTALTRAQMEG